MTMIQLLYVLEVAHSKNISKAASGLFVSQPALSLQIQKLETELGYTLFHREVHGVSLTPAGIAFCQKAQPVVEAWRKLQAEVGAIKHAVDDRIRIGIGSRAFSNGVFDEIITFFDGHPEIGVSFITGIAEDPFDLLAENKIDIAVDRRPAPSMSKNIARYTIIELLRERQCVLVSPKDPRKELTGLPFEQLNGKAVVSGPENSLDDLVLKEECKNRGVGFSKIYRADKIEAVMKLVQSGNAAAIGPASFARQYGVAAIPMLPEIYIPLNLICLKQNRDAPLFVELKRHLLAACGKGSS